MTESLLPFDLPEISGTKFKWCADIAVPLPIEGLYSYAIPSELLEASKPGVRASVPFKNREMTG